QKTETINSMLEGYRDLDKENLKPVLLTSFRVILSQDPHMIVNTFCIYFDILVLHPEFVQSLDLQPLIETLDIISLDQKRLLFDCYFEALFLHPKRDTLKSMMPEFAAQFLRA